MRLAVALLLALAAVSPAAAQEPLKEIWVTQSESGQIVRGRLVALSPGSLSLLTPNHQRVDLPLSGVLRIETKGDSLKNGGIIGAVVWGGLALLVCPNVGDSFCVTGVAINTGLGALVGAGIDAMNGGRATIYARPPAATPEPKRAGLQVRLRF